MTRIATFFVLASLFAVLGCGEAATSIEDPAVDEVDAVAIEVPGETSTDTSSNTSTIEEPDRNSAFLVPVDESDSSSNAVDLSLGNPAGDAAPSREKAEVGVGKKGRGYGGGLVSEPAKQYFAIRERTVFQIQIPQALKLYKAMNGKLPKDHKEFMSKIVKENNISLPELPDGKSYVFDADKGELMIESGGDQ